MVWDVSVEMAVAVMMLGIVEVMVLVVKELVVVMAAVVMVMIIMMVKVKVVLEVVVMMAVCCRSATPVQRPTLPRARGWSAQGARKHALLRGQRGETGQPVGAQTSAGRSHTCGVLDVSRVRRVTVRAITKQRGREIAGRCDLNVLGVMW